jgi:predicted nuclease with RNAse H fold
VSQVLSNYVPGPALLGSDQRDAVAAGIVAAAYVEGSAVPIRGQDGTIWVPQAISSQ